LKIAVWLLAAYGFYAIAIYVKAAVQGWRSEASWARDRRERQAERAKNEWWASEQLRKRRSLANKAMLDRLTVWDHAAIAKVIEDSKQGSARWK
jgi:hypothetical protein